MCFSGEIVITFQQSTFIANPYFKQHIENITYHRLAEVYAGVLSIRELRPIDGFIFGNMHYRPVSSKDFQYEYM